MELCPAAPPPPRRGRRVCVVLLALVLGWLLLLGAVPAALGFHSVVTRSSDPVTGVDAGTLVVARTVSSTDLQPGDLVVAGPADDHPVRRVLASPPGWTIVGDAADQAGTPTATAENPNADRVVLTAPYVAWPVARLGSTVRWALVAILGALLAAAVRAELRARRLGRAVSAGSRASLA